MRISSIPCVVGGEGEERGGRREEGGEREERGGEEEEKSGEIRFLSQKIKKSIKSFLCVPYFVFV